MWGKRKKRTAEPEIYEAREAKARAEAVIAHIESQEPEVQQKVTSLLRRQLKNHFGESLVIAMEKRQ